MTYQSRRRIADISVVLPTAGELVITETGGREVRVQSRFTGCRKYTPAYRAKLVDLLQTASAIPASADGSMLPEKTNIEMMLEAALDEKGRMFGTS